MSGQSIKDRINAAKFTIAGQGLARSVHKATTEEVLGPKKKHVDYLVQCTQEPNVSIPHLANQLIERTQAGSWVIVFKALITIHNLMNYGNERFTQYLASNNCSLQVDNFFDKSTVLAHDMSKFIRRYAKYIHEKSYAYRINAFDFCKVKRGKEDGVLRTMNGEKLLKTLPVLQAQLDALLEFDATPNELTNNVIHAGFILLFKDLIRLFACYNDGVINLLEKYFEMNKKQCKESLDVYKKFLVRMEKVSEFLKVAENMGVDKGDIPDLAKAPSSLLEALEAHLQTLEGKKGASTPTGRPAGFTSTVNNFSKASSGGAGASNSTSPTLGFSEEEKKKALEEEHQTMQQLKMTASSPTQPLPDEPEEGFPLPEDNQQQFQQSSPGASPPQSVGQSTNPFAAAIATTTSNDTVDLFGSSAAFQGQNQQHRPIDDLLGLSGNPFASSVMTQPVTQGNAFMGQPASNPWAGQQLSDAPPTSGFTMSAPQTNNTEINFETAFGTQTQQGYDGFGDVLKPNMKQAETQQQDVKLFQKDLDSSLANIAGNLNINGPGQHVKKTEHQWSPSTNKGQKTGGANWQATMPSATYSTWSQPGMAGPRPGMGMQQQPGMFTGGPQQPSMGTQPNLFQQPVRPQQQQQSQQNDLFGPL